jgi:hypothetical protein
MSHDAYSGRRRSLRPAEEASGLPESGPRLDQPHAPARRQPGRWPPVTFFLPGEGDLETLRRLDPESDWREFARGQRAWILQSYLRLARAGYPAELSGDLPARGLVVFHAQDKRTLPGFGRRLQQLTLIGVRGDLREPLIADFEILQNGRYADGRQRFAVPHWPQAGLLRRDPSRGAQIRTVAYKGFLGNLHPRFLEPEWTAFLRQRGIEWAIDAVPFAEETTEVRALAWNDYSRVDLVLAVRPPDRDLHAAKPATKLFNAWRAGVPALLGPEWAYREVRRSPLDYLEISSPNDARQEVDRLASDPELYSRMVAQGRDRAHEVTAEAVTRRWAQLLYETLPPLADFQATRLLHHLPPRLKVLVKRLHRLASGQPLR